MQIRHVGREGKKIWGVSEPLHSLVVVVTPRAGPYIDNKEYKGLSLAFPWPSCSVLSDRYERGVWSST